MTGVARPRVIRPYRHAGDHVRGHAWIFGAGPQHLRLLRGGTRSPPLHSISEGHVKSVQSALLPGELTRLGHRGRKLRMSSKCLTQGFYARSTGVEEDKSQWRLCGPDSRADQPVEQPGCGKHGWD